MRTGTFVELPGQPHVPRRHALLDSSATLPMPLGGAVTTCGPTPDEVADAALDQVARHGVAVLQLSEPLSDQEFVKFGARLGHAAPETAPDVQPFVTDEVILNLVSRHGHTDKVALQPFAVNSLSLHAEGSGRPGHEQPRHIVLMCCFPGEHPRSAQTVLVSMADVLAPLSPRQREVLRHTRYAHLPAGQTILRGDVFSFRDFLGDELSWVNEAGHDPDEVADAVAALLTAMYAAPAAGVHWSRGLLVVIDNTRFFHGRTAGIGSPRTPRHLKRLRIR